MYEYGTSSYLYQNVYKFNVKILKRVTAEVLASPSQQNQPLN